MMVLRYHITLQASLHALLAMMGMPLWQVLHLRKLLFVCRAIHRLPVLPLNALQAALNYLRAMLNLLRAMLLVLRLPRDRLRAMRLPLRLANNRLLLIIDYLLSTIINQKTI
jgi:hypothetical protein